METEPDVAEVTNVPNGDVDISEATNQDIDEETQSGTVPIPTNVVLNGEPTQQQSDC